MTGRTWRFLSFSVKIALGILLLLQYSSITVFLPTLYFHYIILKVHIKHIMYFGIFTAYQSLSTLICTSVFLLPETCLHVHFKNVMLKPIDVLSWEDTIFQSSHQQICFLFYKYICHVRCNTVCCVLLWFKSLIFTDIINISFIILCARRVQSPVARIILFCFFCFTKCFILR